MGPGINNKKSNSSTSRGVSIDTQARINEIFAEWDNWNYPHKEDKEQIRETIKLLANSFQHDLRLPNYETLDDRLRFINKFSQSFELAQPIEAGKPVVIRGTSAKVGEEAALYSVTPDSISHTAGPFGPHQAREMVAKLASVDASMLMDDGIELSGTPEQRKLITLAIHEYRQQTPDGIASTPKKGKTPWASIFSRDKEWQAYVDANPFEESTLGAKNTESADRSHSRNDSSGPADEDTSGPTDGPSEESKKAWEDFKNGNGGANSENADAQDSSQQTSEDYEEELKRNSGYYDSASSDGTESEEPEADAEPDVEEPEADADADTEEPEASADAEPDADTLKSAFKSAVDDPSAAESSKLKDIFDNETIVRLRQAVRTTYEDFEHKTQESIDSMLIRKFDKAANEPNLENNKRPGTVKNAMFINGFIGKLNEVYGNDTYYTDEIIDQYRTNRPSQYNAA